MAGRYAEDTRVPVARTRDEIERTLRRYGAEAFSYGWDNERAVIMFQAAGRRIRFDIEMPHLAEFRVTEGGQRRSDSAAQVAREKAVKQRWRALALVIKAKLEAVASGIVTFEQEFLAHVLLPDGSKVGDWMAPQLDEVYASGDMPTLLPPVRGTLTAGQEP
jgi:hypothetical protein